LFAKHRDRQHIFQRLTYRNAGRTLQQIGREPLLEPGLPAKRSPRSAGYTALSFFAGKSERRPHDPTGCGFCGSEFIREGGGTCAA
jgi:hypothetical protein